jgi:hypothetical protein
MSTTLLFVELLIAGVQVVVWFSLLVFSVFGYEWVSNIQSQALSDWEVLVSITVLAFVYVLGILFDRLADLIFSKWDRKIAIEMFPHAPHTFAVIRFQISKGNDYLNHQFEYTRSRLRIARASALNFAITTVLAVIFIAVRLQGIPDHVTLLVFASVTGSLLTVLAVITWYKLVHSYFGLIRANYAAQSNSGEVKQNPPAAKKQH